jgi:hypothetical protein
LQVELDERVAASDRRYVDLSKWAHAARKVGLLNSTKRAAAQAHASTADEATVSGYAKALDTLATALAADSGKTRIVARSGPAGTTTGTTTTSTKKCLNPHDPICHNGEMLGAK